MNTLSVVCYRRHRVHRSIPYEETGKRRPVVSLPELTNCKCVNSPALIISPPYVSERYPVSPYYRQLVRLPSIHFIYESLFIYPDKHLVLSYYFLISPLLLFTRTQLNNSSSYVCTWSFQYHPRVFLITF